MKSKKLNFFLKKNLPKKLLEKKSLPSDIMEEVRKVSFHGVKNLAFGGFRNLSIIVFGMG